MPDTSPERDSSEFIEAELIDEESTDDRAAERPEDTTLQLPPRAPIGAPARTIDAAALADAARAASRPAALSAAHPLADAEALVNEARRRAEASVKLGDRLALARARTEHAVLLEVLKHDVTGAEAEFRAAHAIAPSLRAPIAAVRRLVPYSKPATALSLIESELRVTRSENHRAVRLLECGRLLLAGGAAAEKAAQAFREVLAINPEHPAALRALESALRARPRAADPVAWLDAVGTHLAQMSSAWRDDPTLSAWLEVERAGVLEKLKRPEAARAALQGALQLDPGLGPTRDAYVRHLVAHQDTDLLVDTWATEATLEGDTPRAGRLFYAAGRLCSERLEQPDRAIELHRRATALPTAAPFTQNRALHELLRLYQGRGDPARALEVQMQLLAWATPSERPHWHTRIAAELEAQGRPDEAAEHAQKALQSWPDDDDTRERLDRMLASGRRHQERVALWLTEATRLAQVPLRVQALERAARISEGDLGRIDAAVLNLRSAWALDPDNLAVSDELTRLLAVQHARAPDERVHARIDLLAEMAASTQDGERRLAHLEKAATLYEDELNDPERACAIYRQIVTLAPQRRSGLLGLGRTAARAGDHRELYRALVLEAAEVGSVALTRALRLRAADVASRALGDADSAIELVQQVLAQNPGDPQALRAAADIHVRTGHFADAVAQLRLLLQHARKGAGAFALAIEIARLLDERMRRPAEALVAYREAFRIDPAHPLPIAEIRRLLLASEDDEGLARELLAMAQAPFAQADQLALRGRLFFEAAEIYGDRLDQPEPQKDALAQARACCPDEPHLVEALERAHFRQGRLGELALLLEQKAHRSVQDELTLATLLADGRDPARAATILQQLMSRGDADVATVRTLEHTCAQREQWNVLGEVLRAEVALFKSPTARLGALHELFFLETHRGATPPHGAPGALELLLEAAPQDVLANEAFIRGGLRANSASEAARLAQALGVVAEASDDALHAAMLQLCAALLIDARGADDVPTRRETARRYRIALASWPDCLTAARGVYRLGHKLLDAQLIVDGAIALGKLEPEPSARAERLADAAEALTATHFRRAEDLYVRALNEHADCARAADGLLARAEESEQPAVVSDALRSAIERTGNPAHAVRLGAALAELARQRLADPTMVLEALRRVRKKAPGNVSNLLALADACGALLLWPEAAEIAEGALGITRDPGERLGAAVLVAGALAHVPSASAAAVHRAAQAEELAGSAPHEAQSAHLVRLCAVYRVLGEHHATLRVLARALAVSGADSELLGWVAEHAAPATREGALEYVHVIEQALSWAEKLRLPAQPAWLLALGNVEALELGEVQRGIEHVRDALRLDRGDPATYESLAGLLTTLGQPEDAARELLACVSALLSAPLPAARVAAVLEVVSRACRAGGRMAQAAELTQLAGYLQGHLTSRTPSLSEGAPPAEALGWPVLSTLLARDDSHPWLQVAAVVEDAVPKLLRAEATALGVAARDRLARGDVHPLRVLADRVARAFGELQFDLYVDARTVATPRLVPSDPPAIVLPRGYADLPQSEQAAGMGRLLVYVALKVPWIEELGSDDLVGILFGSLRAARDTWRRGTLGARDEASVESWRGRLGKALSRKHKRALEDLADQGDHVADPERFRSAVRTAGVIGAYVITSDLVSTLNHLRRVERELGSQVVAADAPHPILQHAAARRLIELVLQRPLP